MLRERITVFSINNYMPSVAEEQFAHYVIGHPAIDADHYRLLCLFQSCKKINSPEELVAELQRLRKYWSDHTVTETDFMVSINFPFLVEHLKQHALVAGEISKVILKVGDMSSNSKVISQTANPMVPLLSFLLSHIDNYDMQFAKYVNPKEAP